MGDRCEKCEQVAAELRAELRAEFDQLREGFVRRIDERQLKLYRTCRSPASGSPTGFTVRHTTGQLGAGLYPKL
jgi:hypothetical protein